MKNVRKKYVVDTNVPMTANLELKLEERPDIPKACRVQCSEAVEKIISGECVVIDDDGEVLCEYGRNLSRDPAEPGIGHFFMQWVSDHQGDSSKVCRVPLTPNNQSYLEFPHSPGLAGFHKKDHKFIALANACNKTPVILQATDSKWWKYKSAFKQIGIKVCFLCPGFVKKTYTKKNPNNTRP
ncbi:MAG: hypothetical protein OD918_02255 [Gammaproteobacteria bacterium]